MQNTSKNNTYLPFYSEFGTGNWNCHGNEIVEKWKKKKNNLKTANSL